MITLTLAQANKYAPNSLDTTVGQMVLDGVIAEIEDRFPAQDTAPLTVLGLKIFALEVAYMGGMENQDYVAAKVELYRAAGYYAPTRIVGPVADE